MILTEKQMKLLHGRDVNLLNIFDDYISAEKENHLELKKYYFYEFNSVCDKVINSELTTSDPFFLQRREISLIVINRQKKLFNDYVNKLIDYKYFQENFINDISP